MGESKNLEEQRTERNKKVKVGVLIVILIVLLLMIQCSRRALEQVGPAPIDLAIDENSEEGGHKKTEKEKIQEELNKTVEDGMINISMNTNPIYKDGGSKGTLLIVNETINKYAQMVEIYRDDTGELIYKSGLIPVGSKIETAKLDTKMPRGLYKCTAYFSSINEETQEVQGKAGAKIEITILK